MTEVMLSNNPKTLAEIQWSASRCVKCNMCKFPPLARVESQAHSMGCPAYEHFYFNASSGAGMVIMANSLLAGRSEVTDAMRDVVYGCTLCGLCDVSCKFNVDIEVLETLLLLRHEIFKAGKIPAPHRGVLECIRAKGHPLPELADAPNLVPAACHTAGADTLVWVGPHFSRDPGLIGWLRDMLSLLAAAGVHFQLLLGAEPYTGRAALEIGDRGLFGRLSERVSEAIRSTGAKEILCLSAEDYSTLRTQTPRFAPQELPVRHITEVYADLTARRSPRSRAELARAAWHDPCYLGRLGGRYHPWEGRSVKLHGADVYDPPRPVDHGTGGVFAAPRHALTVLLGAPPAELERRKEYAFNAGESGQAPVGSPELSRATARRRVAEAAACGVRTIVTECPQARATLAAAGAEASIDVTTLTALMAGAYL